MIKEFIHASINFNQFITELEHELAKVTLAHLIVAVASFLFTLLIIWLKQKLFDKKFKRFFSLWKSNSIKLVYGTLSPVIQLDGKPIEFNSLKKYISGMGGVAYSKRISKFVGVSSITALEWLTIEISKFKKIKYSIIDDEEALKNLSRTYISIGGPLTNELTKIALSEINKPLYKLSNVTNNHIDVFKRQGAYYVPLVLDLEFDYGLILKAKNIHETDQSKRINYILCFGLTSTGTLGATYYLANNWRKLLKKFGDNEFGVILKVRKNAPTDIIVEEEREKFEFE